MKAAKEKNYQIEIIRIIAIIFVIFNHTRVHGFELYKVNTMPVNFYPSFFLAMICKSAVPLFFMVSGAVLLGKEETFKDFFVKRIVRIVVVIVVFTALQYIRLCLARPDMFFDIKDMFAIIYAGNAIETYWYLKAYLGFLLIVPFLRKIVLNSDKKLAKYLLLLMLIKIIVSIPNAVLGYYYPNVTVAVLENVIFYPLMGYYISREVSDGSALDWINWKTTILITAIIFAIYVMLYRFSEHFSAEWPDGRAHFLLPVITLFVFTSVLRINVRLLMLRKVVIELGGTAFGIYLIEDVIRNIFEYRLNWNYLLPIEIIGAVVFSLVVWAVSAAIIWIVKKIPYVARFI